MKKLPFLSEVPEDLYVAKTPRTAPHNAAHLLRDQFNSTNDMHETSNLHQHNVEEDVTVEINSKI